MGAIKITDGEIKKIFLSCTRPRSEEEKNTKFYFPIRDFNSTLTAGPSCVPVMSFFYNSYTRGSCCEGAIKIANGELKKYFLCTRPRSEEEKNIIFYFPISDFNST